MFVGGGRKAALEGRKLPVLAQGTHPNRGASSTKAADPFADFEYRSVFNWEHLSVCSANEEEAETVWSPDALENGRCRIYKTEQRPGWCRPGN